MEVKIKLKGQRAFIRHERTEKDALKWKKSVGKLGTVTIIRDRKKAKPKKSSFGKNSLLGVMRSLKRIKI